VFKSRLLLLISGIILSLTLGLGISAPIALAQDETTTTTTTTTASPPSLRLKCDVPAYSDNSGATFSYNVTMVYNGNDTLTVKLAIANPTGWNSSLQYNGKEVDSLPIGPIPNTYSTDDSKTLTVSLSPNIGVSPDPGNYVLTLNATSGQFNTTIDLTATVKDKFQMQIAPSDSKYSTTAITGKVSNFSFNVQNTGTATLESTAFSTNAPSGWIINFSPQNINSLGANQTQQVNATITPPSGKTVAGDYMIYFYADSGSLHQSMDIRVTVQTSSVWGVVSIIIIVVVVLGLGVLFWRLGRR
jgi:uncharacterized membrane protein